MLGSAGAKASRISGREGGTAQSGGTGPATRGRARMTTDPNRKSPIK